MPQSLTLDDLVIVIVDDSDDLRFSVAEFLAARGAMVFACSDALQGLEAVRVHHPDIVLSDISLSNRDGFLLLQDIRLLARGHGGDVPVIAMTALGDIVAHSRTMVSGFQTYLDKPFAPEQLLTAIYSTLEISRNRVPVQLGRRDRSANQ